MYVAIVVLKRDELLQPVSSALIECGLFESSVLDGEGIENVAGQTSELFRELRGIFGKDPVYNRTIVIYLPERGLLDDFLLLCKQENIDFTNANTGFIMMFPCELYIGPEEGR